MKLIKTISAAAIAAALAASCCFHVFADTYYVREGFRFNVNNEEKSIVYGMEDTEYSVVSIPETLWYRDVIGVGAFAFSGDKQVTTLSFENAAHAEYTSAYSFENCTNLTSVKLNPNMTTIGIGAFEGCTSLNAFDWANAAVEVISTQTFYGCASLSEMVIPDKVTTIQPFAFANCSALRTVTIGTNVTQIADSAFNNDSELTIACYYGSCAHEFAVAHSIPCVLLDSVLLGDATGDGNLNINDVTSIQRAVAEIGTLDGLRQKAADVNADGVVTIDDATILQMYLAEFATDYPIGEVTAQ